MKADYLVPGSYRPISVVNCGSKIFELAILARLRWVSANMNSCEE